MPGFPSKNIPHPKEEEEDEDEVIEDEEGEEVEPFDLVAAMQEIDAADRATVYGLRGITSKIQEIYKQMQAEISAMEKTLHEKSLPLYEERRKLVSGEREPTAEEIAAGADQAAGTVEEIPSDDEDKKKDDKKKVRVVAVGENSEAAEKGIPEFWRTAMQNHEIIESFMSERDLEGLHYLTDVNKSFLENDPTKGFVLNFHFAENPYFTNTVLTKIYKMDTEDHEVLDKAIGCEINWTSPSKNLTIEVKEKKQRSKTGKGIRIVKREEQVPSFFRFFTPVDPEEEVDETNEAKMAEMEANIDPNDDYELGLAIRDGLIPRGVFYYTGEALSQLASGLQFGDDEEGEDDEDDEDDEDEEEEDVPVIKAKGKGPSGGAGPSSSGAGGKKPEPKPAECKQQ